MTMRRRPLRTAFVSLLCALLAYGIYLSTLDESSMPPLKDGDLIFQTTLNSQTMAIALASGSVYIHTGIIKNTPQGPQVIHAARQVTHWPLSQWISGGVLKRFAVYRYKGLSDEQGKQVVAAAEKYNGRPYDFYFSFSNDSIYCSELDYLSFNDAKLPLGGAQKIGSLNINNRFVKHIIEQRWQQYPACAGKGYDFETCYNVIMEGELVTPSSIAHDPHLELIFSNYP